MKTAKLKIQGMHCASCPIMIDGTLEDSLDGVISAHTHYARQVCVVDYDEEEIDIEDIMSAIEDIGYTVESYE